mmetsp:Transcript_11595/g.41369  ORF Transcript_11595/g.41369 Transcript_11595/m.41369 type:complete len:210 (+) Transcript_11595:204-833(+)
MRSLEVKACWPSGDVGRRRSGDVGLLRGGDLGGSSGGGELTKCDVGCRRGGDDDCGGRRARRSITTAAAVAVGGRRRAAAVAAAVVVAADFALGAVSLVVLAAGSRCLVIGLLGPGKFGFGLGLLLEIHRRHSIRHGSRHGIHGSGAGAGGAAARGSPVGSSRCDRGRDARSPPGAANVPAQQLVVDGHASQLSPSSFHLRLLASIAFR